jgi:ABC-type Fe3+-hydroxamate transport system substrate-binding protein
MLPSRVALASFLVVACAACSQNGASPTPSPSSSSTTSAPSAPTSSVPPGLSGYSEQERAAYLKAVAAYDAFTRRNDRFYAAGQTTVAAKRFYQRYAVDWSTAWGDLAVIANNKVTVTGATKTVWTKPKSIELGGPKADAVVLRRCLDESGRVVTQNGKKVDQPQFKDPHIYTVRLEKRRGEDWWRSGTVDQGPTC